MTGLAGTPETNLPSIAASRIPVAPPLDYRPSVTRISISSTRAILILGTILATLSAVSIALPFIARSGIHIGGALYRLLDVRNEANIPTLFQTVQFGIACALAYVAGRAEHAARFDKPGYWFGLALIFAYMAVDEMAQLHEKLASLHLGSSMDIAKWVWMAIYAPAAVLIAALYFPFLLALPRRTAATFVIGGSVFVMGAVGFEALGLCQTDVQQLAQDDLLVSLRANAEEFLEMAGILIWIWGTLDYLKLERSNVLLSFAGTGSGE
jgi:hypothetical protein